MRAPSALQASPVRMHVVAFQQALDLGHAPAKQAEDEGAMRDRFVAGRAHAARERAAAAAGQRLRRVIRIETGADDPAFDGLTGAYSPQRGGFAADASKQRGS